MTRKSQTLPVTVNGWLRNWDNELVLFGELSAESLVNLQVDEYQREKRPRTQLSELIEAFRDPKATIPPIDLGVRGHTYKEEGDVYTITDPVYIIDGLQRVTAAMDVLTTSDPVPPVVVYAMLHFGSTVDYERERFEILNSYRKPVNASKMLANARHQNEALQMLWGLTHNTPKFALNNRIQWQQSKGENDLMAAVGLAKVMGAIHAQKFNVPYTGSWKNVASALGHLVDRQNGGIGLQPVRENTITFFDSIHEAWGIRDVDTRANPPQLKLGFLVTLAKVFADYEEQFWEDNHLTVPPSVIRKLRGLNLMDPQIAGLAGSMNHGSRKLLFSVIVDHLDFRRRQHKRLRRIRP
jgi:hypothetical protein